MRAVSHEPAVKKYRTRLFEMDRNLRPASGAWGLGWNIRQRHFTMRFALGSDEGPNPNPELAHHMRAILTTQVDATGAYVSRLAPELIIEAKDFNQARRVLRLVSAAHCLTEMQALDDDALPVPDDPSDYPPALAWQLDHQLKLGSAAHGYFRAARVAAKASKKMLYQHSLAKFYHGFRMSGLHWAETHPSYGSNTAITGDPLDYVGYAQAIIAYYSVIEELNAHVIASSTMPSRLRNGDWNPPVLEDLKRRLKELGVDPNRTVVWLLRGSPNRIERMHGVPQGSPAEWSGGRVRDREVSIADAIQYASLLRSRVSAHRVSARTKSLTLAHVCNVQMLARELLLTVLEN